MPVPSPLVQTARRHSGALLGWIDALPFTTALAAGAVAGILVGAVAGLYPAWPAALGAAAAGGLVWSARPVVQGRPQREAGRELLDMVPIPAGRFSMGSPEDELDRRLDEGLHEVGLPGFVMARTPVTRGQYRRWGEQRGRTMGRLDNGLPVAEVSWVDAARYCNALSKHAGYTPCYEFEGEQVTWKREANGYRLPTEAEWEYAARAGTSTPWSCGADHKALERYAWFEDNSGGRVHPVGGKRPNPWGLRDMHGNVWEWCWDWYGEYPRGPVTDPAGPAQGDERHL